MMEPAAKCDPIDLSFASEHSALHFDDSLGAWVLSRYADVLAAFHCSSLFPAGLNSKPLSDRMPENVMQKMRRETRDALSPVQLRVWRRRVSLAARALIKDLSSDQPVELLNSYARPVCLTLAAMVTNIDLREAERLRGKAEPIAASAAEPFDAHLKASAKTANVKIRGCFRAGPEPLRDSGFVALAHTLPRLLANAWFILLNSPGQWAVLHKEPKLAERAVEELLRCSGLPRILFRTAIQDVEFNGVYIRKGERVVLRVLAANLDPQKFANPHQLDVKRRRIRHLALGAGSHSCVGAGLIRMAAVSISRPLLERFSDAELTKPVEWRGGSGYRFPASLWVQLGAPLVLMKPE
jgi:cytochrome P450